MITQLAYQKEIEQLIETYQENKSVVGSEGSNAIYNDFTNRIEGANEVIAILKRYSMWKENHD